MTPTDSSQRRGVHLLDAALTVVAADGLGGLSMRSVATMAGTSSAQVQYYFHTKNELVQAAFNYMADQFLTVLHGLPDTPSVARLRQAIWLWLPLDSHQEKAARVWLAFAAAAATSPELASESARLDADLRAWFTAELQTLQRSGEVDNRDAPGSVAAQLLGLIDGITIQSLTISTDERDRFATDTIDAFLQHLTIHHIEQPAQ